MVDPRKVSDVERERLLAVVEGVPTTKAIDRTAEDEVDVWPHLLFKELIATVMVILFFTVVSIYFNAPLEEMANPTKTPNPAKAPWYFLGLQELLVYFDPWIAGVMLPLIMIVGLMAIPYLDFNNKGTGKYTFRDRKFAFTVFTFGIVLWFVLIVIGTFLRGPSWAWYWPWESWEVHKEVASSMTDLPTLLGTVLLALYFGAGMVLPWFMFADFRKKLGTARYVITVGLLLLMVGVVGKIVLRLVFDVKYIVATPWFNV